jgi:hypothetical protein
MYWFDYEKIYLKIGPTEKAPVFQRYYPAEKYGVDIAGIE